MSTAISMYRYPDDETIRGHRTVPGDGSGTPGAAEKKIHGASFPSTIWQDYMSDAVKGMKVEKFPEAGAHRRGHQRHPSPTPTPSPSPSASKTEDQPVAVAVAQ